MTGVKLTTLLTLTCEQANSQSVNVVKYQTAGDVSLKKSQNIQQSPKDSSSEDHECDHETMRAATIAVVIN